MAFRRAIDVMFSPKYLMVTNCVGSFGFLLAGDYLEQKYTSKLIINEEHRDNNQEFDKRRARKCNDIALLREHSTSSTILRKGNSSQSGQAVSTQCLTFSYFLPMHSEWSKLISKVVKYGCFLNSKKGDNSASLTLIPETCLWEQDLEKS